MEIGEYLVNIIVTGSTFFRGGACTKSNWTFVSVQIMGANDAVLTECYHTCPSEVSIAEDE